MFMELTNKERKCLALNEVQKNWLKKNFNDQYWIYIDGNKLVKRVFSDCDSYYESDVLYFLSDDYQFILPKTNRGKPKKVTESAVRNLSNGGYLFWGNGNIVIGNGNNEQAYYDSYITGIKITSLIDFQNWISDWVNHTTLEEQDKINHYKLSYKKHYKYQEGDYFRFSLDRNLYGYGRILLDIRKRQKQGYYYWDIIMGRPIIIEVFHIITERKDVSVAELKNLKTFPSQYILENVIYYGEYEIIGHEKLPDFLAYPIMYGKSISMNENNICFQCGLIYKQIPIVDSKSIVGDFKNNGVDFNIHNDLVTMKKCISTNSNLPYWEKYCYDLDLRNPKYHDELVRVLQQFDLLYLLDLYQDC